MTQKSAAPLYTRLKRIASGHTEDAWPLLDSIPPALLFFQAYFLVLSPPALAFVLGDLCMGASCESWVSSLTPVAHGHLLSSLLVLTLILKHLALEQTLSPARQHDQREGSEG